MLKVKQRLIFEVSSLPNADSNWNPSARRVGISSKWPIPSFCSTPGLRRIRKLAGSVLDCPAELECGITSGWVVGHSSKARIPRARLSLGSAWSADIYAVFGEFSASLHDSGQESC
jgi:hypothetical protein